MSKDREYFLCGIGGSGMLPLASIINGKGEKVAGSDRALDQGRTSAKFDYLRNMGIDLFAQDGSGLTHKNQILVASAAVEDSVPDVVNAKKLGCARMSRAELLSSLFNDAKIGIAVGGTSGKSTVTGMIGWIFHACGKKPTTMNGAVMKNFATPEALFASALVGDGDSFISEVDESDGSIALYNPSIAVLNNITLDHKSMDELRELFSNFVGRADHAVINADDPEAAALSAPGAIRFGIENDDANISASNLAPATDHIRFDVLDRSSGDSVNLRLKMPGAHNVSNALAALGAAIVAGISLGEAVKALEEFAGLNRRMDVIGNANAITVIDDFGHNPDKIGATLKSLHDFPGRLLLFFQPHGFGPLRKMGKELAECFIDNMSRDDQLLMCDPVYFGGTVDRSVGSETIIGSVAGAGKNATHIAKREDCGDRLVEAARPGDRIVIMGARDDTLAGFAQDILARL